MSFRFRAVPIFALAVSMLACGTKKGPDADSAAAANAPLPVAPAAVSVKNVNLGKSILADKSIGDNTATFGPHDTMYVSVETDGVGAGVIGVRWATKAGVLVDSSSQPISSTGEARTEFHVMKKKGMWPAGEYQVDVMLNGVSAGTKPFDVKNPK